MKRQWLTSFCIILTATFGLAQGAYDGYMKGRGNTDIVLTYSRESYDVYRFGTEDQQISNEITSYSLFIEHAFSDTFDLILSLPYVHIDEENSNFQDAIVGIKYRNQHFTYDKSALSIITAVGISFPTSNYSTNTATPIGARASTFQARLIAQHNWYSGAFIQLQSGYDFQFAPTALNAIPVVVRAGFGTAKVYLDAWIDFYHTFNAGADAQIAGGQGSRWIKIGGTVYYSITPKFGALVSAAHFLTGENIGLSTRLNAGVVYKMSRK